MVLNINERSYGGKKFRPVTEVLHDKSNNLFLCITPWGRPDIIEKVSQSITNFLTMANEDTDLTVAYERKQNLHQKGNILRTSVIMASEKINNEYNEEEYTAGFEIFAAIQDGPQWIYVSCGQPSAILCREGLGTLPLSQSLDLNILTPKKTLKDPLPNQLLGLGQNPPIQFGNLRLKPKDRISLISRPYIPSHFFQLTTDQFNEKNIADILAKDSQDIPFWLCCIGVN